MPIRRARRDDLGPIADLQTQSWRGTYGGSYPPEFLADQLPKLLAEQWAVVKLDDKDLVLVAEEDGGLDGFIAVRIDPLPYIANLHVRPDLRSAGLGRRLMAAAAEALIAGGHHTAHLLVVVDNARAIAFYERLGGVCGEPFDTEFHGHPLRACKITWDDLGAIVAAASRS